MNDIESFIKSVNHFMFLCEFKQWLKNVTVEEIKNSFKCARFIERVVETAKENNCTEELQEILYKEKSEARYYNLKYLQNACDYLLIMIFKTMRINKDNVDIAIRIYQTMLPKIRFQNVVRDTLTKSISFQNISQFALENLDKNNSTELQYRLLLNNLTLKKDNLSDEVENTLNGCKINENLSQLIGAISLSTHLSLNEDQTQINIANMICQKLTDKSAQNSKYLWIAILKHVDYKMIAKVTEKYSDFSVALIDLIIFIASSMVLDKKANWVIDENIPNACSEISYYDLVVVFHLLVKNDVNMSLVKEKLVEASEMFQSEIFKDIIKIVC